MENFIVPGVILALILTFFISGKIADKRKKNAFASRLREQFGRLPEEELLSSDLEQIRKLHDSVRENADTDRFVIDDLTWNDLSMDEIFGMLNATQSSAGEEMLYHLLHSMDLAGTSHFGALSDFFFNKEEERVRLQMILHRLGKNRRFSMTDVLKYAGELKQEKNTAHVIVDILLLASFALIFFMPAVGVLLFLIFLAYSVLSYFHRKAQITPYFTTFVSIVRMIDCAQELLLILQDSFTEDTAKLREILSSCKSFRKNIVFLTSGVALGGTILDVLMDYVRIIFHIDIIKFNSMLRFLQEHREEINTLRMLIGTYDAAIAAANVKKAYPAWCVPEFIPDKSITIMDASHPLLKDPVCNSISTGSGVLITGSNASGKSTFIKSVALCCLFAQTIGIVPAKEYRACRFRLLTSMAVSDQISGGESYFVAEIRSLKRIVDLASLDGAPVLCFVDEVLRGTNTIERIAASSRILHDLNLRNAICFAATHDIELTKILRNDFCNMHFEEEVDNDDVRFNYRLLEGPSRTRNAIRLLKITGFDEDVIKDAEDAAEEFTNHNSWSVMS